MNWLETGEQRPIRRTVLREEVKNYILDAVISGNLKAGDRIIETQVARHLGISQAPVREAIRDLEQMGVVQSEPHRGASVRTLSRRELQEMYAVRALIEGTAGELAAAQATPEFVAQLDELVGRMVAAAQAGDQRQMVTLDVAFHELILERSGNRFLLWVWQLMQPANWTLVTAKIYHPALVALAERHREILAALRSGDGQRAGAVMRRHIEELAAGAVEMARD